jgi:CHAT domain-containing protein
MALARTGAEHEALLVLEQGRVRALSDLRVRDTERLDQLRAAHPALFERYRHAVVGLEVYDSGLQCLSFETAAYELASTSLSEFNRDGQRRQAVIAAFEQANAELRALPEYAELFAQPDLPLIAESIEPGSALIYLVAGIGGSVALIVTRTAASEKVSVTPVISDDLADQFRNQLRWGSIFTENADDRSARLATIERCGALLHQYLMGPLLEACARLGLKSATLIPTGILTILPLHAAWSERDGQRIYACDQLRLSYAPSAAFWQQAQARVLQIKPERLLTIANPNSLMGSSLPFAEAEAAAIAAYFQTDSVTTLGLQEATLEKLLNGLPATDVFHAACHASTHFTGLSNELNLSYIDRLTIDDLLTLRLNHLRLVVLSACETGLIDLDLPDESLGFATAFLYTGCSGVISSLWAVSDISTAMLMERFYAFWQGAGCDPREALWRAQRWMYETSNGEKKALYRDALSNTKNATSGINPDFAALVFRTIALLRDDNKTFAHAYYWAPFIYTGA